MSRIYIIKKLSQIILIKRWIKLCFDDVFGWFSSPLLLLLAKRKKFYVCFLERNVRDFQITPFLLSFCKNPRNGEGVIWKKFSWCREAKFKRALRVHFLIHFTKNFYRFLTPLTPKVKSGTNILNPSNLWFFILA